MSIEYKKENPKKETENGNKEDGNENLSRIKMVQNNLKDYENYHLEKEDDENDPAENHSPAFEGGSMIEKNIDNDERDKNNRKENISEVE